jgi:hypothetical protein
MERYQGAIEEAGTYASDVASTYQADYANGNTISRTNAVQQYNVGQMRVQTASAYTINSPSFCTTAQQVISQCRFEHHAGDMYQGSHIYYWIRAEDTLTLIGDTTARYNEKELAEYSANATYASGNLTTYADVEWKQVGQFKGPLHPTNSRSAANYGDFVQLVQGKYKAKSRSVVFNTEENFSIRANTDLNFSCSTYSLASTIGSTIMYSVANTRLRGESSIDLSSGGPAILDGGIVFINCGKSASFSTPGPNILAELPRTFENMKEVADYPRETPVSPGPRGTRGNKTPEPGTTPEDINIGDWLTRHV